MTDDFRSEPSLAFWLVSGAALIWNLFGFYMYFAQVTSTAEGLAAAGFSPAQIAFIDATPAWVTSAFALSVTAGVLGSLFLLLRKRWAFPLFVLSLVSVLVQNVYSFVLNDVTAVFGTAPLIIQSMVIVIAAALTWYSKSVRARGWLG
jgi:hypothetical protein